jgi:hypothetical protein
MKISMTLAIVAASAMPLSSAALAESAGSSNETVEEITRSSRLPACRSRRDRE